MLVSGFINTFLYITKPKGTTQQTMLEQKNTPSFVTEGSAKNFVSINNKEHCLTLNGENLKNASSVEGDIVQVVATWGEGNPQKRVPAGARFDYYVCHKSGEQFVLQIYPRTFSGRNFLNLWVGAKGTNLMLRVNKNDESESVPKVFVKVGAEYLKQTYSFAKTSPYNCDEDNIYKEEKTLISWVDLVKLKCEKLGIPFENQMPVEPPKTELQKQADKVNAPQKDTPKKDIDDDLPF